APPDEGDTAAPRLRPAAEAELEAVELDRAVVRRRRRITASRIAMRRSVRRAAVQIDVEAGAAEVRSVRGVPDALHVTRGRRGTGAGSPRRRRPGRRRCTGPLDR